MQNLAIRGGPFTQQEKLDLLNYCESDVLALPSLMERLLIRIPRQAEGTVGTAPRVRASVVPRPVLESVARMEHVGVPIDVPTFQQVKARRMEVMEYLIEQGDREYGVFDGTKFQEGSFRRYLAGQGLLDTWPHTGKRGQFEH